MILKRKHIFLLCLFLLLTSFGCSSSASSGGSENDKVTENSESPTTESTPKEDDKKTEKAVSETIEETELLNKNGIILIAKSLDKNSFWGPVIKVYVENTTDGNLTLSLQNLSVNGIMMSDLSSINVAAGKKANDEITIFSSDLEEAGIDVIADIEFQFHIYDSDSWNDVMKTDVLSLHTSAYDGFTFEVDTSGEVLYDKNGIQIISKGLTEAGFLSGPTLKLLIIKYLPQDGLHNNQLTATLHDIDSRNTAYFKQEEERIFNWERDMVDSLEVEIKTIKNDILRTEREARNAQTVAEKLSLEKKVEELKRKRRRMRSELEEREDEVSEQRRTMIHDLEKRMIQNSDSQDLFTIRFTID